MKVNVQTMVSAVLVLTVGQTLFADVVNYPFVAPRCMTSISQPANASGFHMSEDCSQVFVLPPSEGTVEVVAASETSNLGMCESYDKQIVERGKIEDILSSLREELSNKSTSEKRRKEIVDIINFLNAEKDALFNDLRDIPTMSVQVVYSRKQLNHWILEYIDRNIEIVRTRGVNFLPAPITEAYLSFTGEAEDGKRHPMSPVVSAKITGLHPTGVNGEYQMDVVKMNGSMSGQIVLSLSGACPYRGQPINDNIAAHLVSNVTYTVPVMSWAGYVAKLDTNTAIESLVKAWQTRTQFSVSEASSLVSKGTADSAYNFIVTDYTESGIFSDEAKNDFFAERSQAALDRLTNRLLDQLAIAGYLEMTEKSASPVAPEPGYVDEVMSGRSCSKGLFGLIKSCSNYTYTVRVPQGTSAQTVLERVNNTTFVNEESVALREIFHRVYTGTFIPANTK